jgi:ribose-phosphate pyrophosphokinase
MPGNESLAAAIAKLAGAELGAMETRRFPDEESYVRLACEVAGRDVDFLCTLARPDRSILALIFAAATARELGAESVGLIAPYLAYMRQDKRFQPGEAVSSVHFARLLSGAFDRLATVDPHLHRRRELSEIFSIPTRVERAGPLLGEWIKNNIESPLLIGPDAESEQWVEGAAEPAGAPYVVLEKRRLGDRNVRISAPDLSTWRGRRPVLIDDVIASGRTMIEAARLLVASGFEKPFCLAVHALFAGEAYERLLAVCERVVSADTIAHPSNAVSVAPLLA